MTTKYKTSDFRSRTALFETIDQQKDVDAFSQIDRRMGPLPAACLLTQMEAFSTWRLDLIDNHLVGRLSSGFNWA